MHSRISRRLLALVIGSCLLSGLITGLWISLASEHQASAKLVASLELAANRHAARLTQELARKTRVGVAIAGLLQNALIDPWAPRRAVDLQRGADGAVRAIVGDYGAYLAKRSELTPAIARDLETLFHVGPLLGRMAALDFHNFYYEAAAGDLLFETPKDWPLEVQPDEDYRPYFALVAPAQDPQREPAWKPVYYDAIQKLWMTSLRVPVYDGERFLGAVGFDYVLDTLLQDIRDMDQVEGWCDAFLVTANGDLIIHPDYMEKIQAASLNHATLATAEVANAGVAALVKSLSGREGSSQDDLRFLDGDEPSYASVRTIRPLAWRLVLYAPHRAVTAPLRGTQMTVIATSIVLAIILALLLNLVFRRIVLDRLAALATTAGQLGAGHWDAGLPTVQDDEIGSLTTSFADMAGKLRGLVSDLEVRVAQRTAELGKAKEEAETANHAKSAFLSSMSHEIRTPLNAVLGYAQLLGRDDSLAPAQRRAVEVINRSGEHLLQLINDILELSRIEAGRGTCDPEDFDLHDLLAHLDSMFRQRAVEKGLLLHLYLAGDLPRFVRTDQRKLRQILINLLANAVKFTATGGVDLHAALVAGQLTVTVRDSGPGIPDAELASLFTPFYQAAAGRRRSDGTGLGLALSHGFAEVLDGSLGVCSNPGGGACFTLVLPVTISAAAGPQPRRRRILGLASGQTAPRVLVAEDQADSRELLAGLMRAVGCAVEAVGDGAAAVVACRRELPDLIWMDMDMPVLDGLGATAAIRSDAKTQPVIVALTAAAFVEDRRRILAQGCDEVIHKPYSEEALFMTMERLLGIRFLWQEHTAAAAADPGLDDAGLRVALHGLSLEQRERLRLLVVTGDLESIAGMTAEWPDRGLAQAINGLCERYAIDHLLALIDGGATPEAGAAG